MKAATLFSGIGAPECAMPHWDWRWHAEIENFPAAVMAARHPESVNLGDVNAEDFVERALERGRPDVLVFGSPCQSYSVAGKRLGMDDARGNLALVALGIVRCLRPRWFLFENVPGLFSSYSGSAEAESEARGEVERGGNANPELATNYAARDCDEDSDFAAFLAAVQQCGYLGCWRVHDAQYAGVPQRHRRIFFVGHLGDWRPAAAVLFEPEGLRGDNPPRREARERIAGTISAGLERCSADEAERGTLIAGSLNASGKAAGSATQQDAESGMLVAFGGNKTSGELDVATAVRAKGGTGHGDFESETFVVGTLSQGAASHSAGNKNEADMLVVADPISASEARTTSHAGKNFKPHNLIVQPILEAGARTGRVDHEGTDGIGIGKPGDPMFSLQASKQHAVAVSGLRRGTGGGGDKPTLTGDVSPTVDGQGSQGVIAFDTTQITHPENRSKPDDRSPQLSQSGHPPAIAFQTRGSNLDVDKHVTGTIGSNTGRASGSAPMIAFSCKDHGADAVEDQTPTLRSMNEIDGNANGGGQIAVAFQTRIARNGRGQPEEVVPSLSGADAGETSDMRPCVAVFQPSHYTRDKDGAPSELTPPLGAEPDKGDQDNVLMQGAAVRRLTPVECERLQAFEDDYTLIKYRGKDAADGNRYRALGNSMCVHNVQWILTRIEQIDTLLRGGQK